MKHLIAALGLLLGGCSFAPSDEVIKALADNPSTVCIQITSVYGTVRAIRVGSAPVGGTAKINPDCSVQVEGAQTTIGR